MQDFVQMNQNLVADFSWGFEPQNNLNVIVEKLASPFWFTLRILRLKKMTCISFEKKVSLVLGNLSLLAY
jgi:hypothetical protein